MIKNTLQMYNNYKLPTVSAHKNHLIRGHAKTHHKQNISTNMTSQMDITLHTIK